MSLFVPCYLCSCAFLSAPQGIQDSYLSTGEEEDEALVYLCLAREGIFYLDGVSAIQVADSCVSALPKPSLDLTYHLGDAQILRRRS